MTNDQRRIFRDGHDHADLTCRVAVMRSYDVGQINNINAQIAEERKACRLKLPLLVAKLPCDETIADGCFWPI